MGKQAIDVTITHALQEATVLKAVIYLLNGGLNGVSINTIDTDNTDTNHVETEEEEKNRLKSNFRFRYKVQGKNIEDIRKAFIKCALHDKEHIEDLLDNIQNDSSTGKTAAILQKAYDTLMDNVSSTAKKELGK